MKLLRQEDVLSGIRTEGAFVLLLEEVFVDKRRMLCLGHQPDSFQDMKFT